MHEDLQQQVEQQLPKLKMHEEQEHQHERGESQVAAAATTTTTGHGDSYSSNSSSSLLTLAQSGYATPAVPPSTVVNLSNSTDVVIGPMTQYQGPVSIYYMDASMQTAAGEREREREEGGRQ